MDEQTKRALAALPRFSAIDTAGIAPDIDGLLASNLEHIEQLLSTPTSHSWDTLVTPMEEMADKLNRRWSPVSHLHGVADNEALRSAYSTCLPKITDYATRLAQDQRLYTAYKAIRQRTDFASLTPAQQKVIDNALRDFRLAGSELDDAGKHRFREIVQDLANLKTRFEENVLDATQAWNKHVRDRAQLAGVPEAVLGLTAQYAARAELDGWLVTLDFPCYMPVMLYAENRDLREELYRAYATRASDQGPHAGEYDNSETIARTLALRAELARLVGYESYAAYSLATKMARAPVQVMTFLTELAEKAYPVARLEYAELQSFAAAELGIKRLEAWDIAFSGERLRLKKFALSQEDLRPYFPVDQVLAGMFAIVERLFGLEVTALEGVDVWHPDVQFFRIRDATGSLRGMFYLDLYARPGKRGGAWMDECVVRRTSGGKVQYPVAYLTCNFTPVVSGGPSLLTHAEVSTLLHEFGHGLHHMLTLVDSPAVSGINGVAWDAVELPSQLLENWCWQRQALDLLSGHYATGEKLPEDLYERMLGAKNFESGMQTVRQLEFATFDFRLHMEYHSGMSVQSLLDDIRGEVAVVIPPAFNRFQHSFSHIFAGGYGAGYYSYKWAEVLSADAFSRFEEEGVFNRDTGEDFLHDVLEQGGSRDAMDLFKMFRGRSPSIEPLLRHCGLNR